MTTEITLHAAAAVAPVTNQERIVSVDALRGYAGIGMAPLVAVLTLALFAFYTSLGGQKVFQGSLLED